MASNKIGDSDTNCQIKQTDCPVHCDTSNATNRDSSTSENPHKFFFHKIIKYFTRSTARRQSKKKKCDTKERSVSTSKSDEKISVYTSLSSIVDNVIKPDAKIDVKLKRRMVDAITFTTQLYNVLDKVTHENHSNIINHFGHDPSYQYAAKNVDNVISDRGCGPLCVDRETQSINVSEEFSSEASRDAFAKACENRRHTDFILKKIAKITDALTQKARHTSAKEQAAAILASISMAPTKYEMEDQTFENMKSLLSLLIHAGEEPIVVKEKLSVEEIPSIVVEEKPFVVIEKKSSVVVEKKPSVVIEKKPSVVVEETPSIIVGRKLSIVIQKKSSVVIEEKPTIAVEKKPSVVKEKNSFVVMEEEPTIIVEKKLPIVVTENSTAIIVASSTVMQPKIHEKRLESPPNHFISNSQDFSESLQLDKSPSALDIQEKPSIEDLRKTKRTRAVSVTFPKKDDLGDIADRVVARKKTEEKKELLKKTSLRRKLDKHAFTEINDEKYVIINCIPKVKKKRPKRDQPDILNQKETQTDYSVSKQEVVRSVDSPIKILKKEKELVQKTTKEISQKYKKPKYRAKYSIEKKEKKILLKKDSMDFIESSKCLISLPAAIKASKIFDPIRPTMKDCHRTLSESLKPTRYCKDLSSICLRRPKYCDVWATPCLTSKDTVNGAFPQDSCAIKYRASCHSLIDNSSRYCNIDTNCTKYRVTFENSLCTNMDGAEYYYPHLNNIDNVQMRYYHCPVLNNQQCVWNQLYY
ncbi:Signal transducer and activator of transcription 2 [Trachymyrmex septentrionalis]|uniref:Signal transducer and activator of transcription 2 n=1 Tax=Trachymyrmex septentrionalis TaxID=34720 RepID=A0A195EUW1_9HYME|nr:PREDICTED: uncharacterized protein LOC108754877 [Trachymyrmex septentrionalis]KYN31941.1 Signal transducer and activator of transcription 2 [Trachymyrmex septentrionalis]